MLRILEFSCFICVGGGVFSAGNSRFFVMRSQAGDGTRRLSWGMT
ncbi:hypothetical protein [Campylobacter sp.]|nr:hypothetical protein [Campylobacter sp.]MDD7091046.1 hypothetical protein [Campylobacteraceae bacterium]MDY3245682.1 hypothetical protein [Campylobacter sp.]